LRFLSSDLERFYVFLCLGLSLIEKTRITTFLFGILVSRFNLCPCISQSLYSKQKLYIFMCVKFEDSDPRFENVLLCLRLQFMSLFGLPLKL